MKNAVCMKMARQPFEKMWFGVGLGIRIEVIDLPSLDAQTRIVNRQQIRRRSTYNEVRARMILVEKKMCQKIHVRASLLPFTGECTKLGKNNVRSATQRNRPKMASCMEMSRLKRPLGWMNLPITSRFGRQDKMNSMTKCGI